MAPVAHPAETAARSAEARINRLSDVSLRRVIEPDVEVLGQVGQGQLFHDSLLSVADLDLELSPEQRAVLSREEAAAVTQGGIAFEGILAAALGMYIAEQPVVNDPRVVYALHEMGEETRHSRLFVRLIDQIQPLARNPLEGAPGRWFMRRIARATQTDRLFMIILVLAGEEVPDLIQKRTLGHPDTDEFIKRVNLYHRQEEARHIAFARLVLPQFWAEATAMQRLRARYVVPILIKGLFETLIHPGVYRTIGLPGWKTWRRVNRSPSRQALRKEATRPILEALIKAGAINEQRIPRPWRRLTGM